MAKGYGLAGQIDSYLTQKGSPLAGYGNVFVSSGRKYGVDPRLVVGISGAESSFGKYNFQPYNAWGWMSGDSYGSWPQSINVVTRGLAKGYIGEGLRTPAEIVSKYAPASAGNDESVWSNNVATFMRELGASPKGSTAKTVVAAAPAAAVPAFKLPEPSVAGLRSGLISSLGQGGQRMLQGVLSGRLEDIRTDEANRLMYEALAGASGAPAAPAAAAGAPAPTPAAGESVNVSKWARLAAGADREGVSTSKGVLDMVARIGKQFGSPLTIGTGTNHNQYVVDTNRESAHWQGNAADIPAEGDALTRLGRAALVVAGMPWQQAAKQTGGVFNLGGYQILFNTTVGGNHYNHLHVGLSGSKVGVK